jgi:hypothetical protein
MFHLRFRVSIAPPRLFQITSEDFFVPFAGIFLCMKYEIKMRDDQFHLGRFHAARKE